MCSLVCISQKSEHLNTYVQRDVGAYLMKLMKAVPISPAYLTMVE